MEKLGYQILVTVLLPGTLLLAAAWLAFGDIFLGSHAFLLVETFLRSEWIGGGSLLLAAALLGTLLGSLMDSLEVHTFDVWTSREQSLTPDDYWEEWLKYVDSLEKGSNPFIDQMALYFFFESRTAVAALVLGITWGFISWGSGEVVIAMILVATAGVLFRAARETHGILAAYRHRRFAKSTEWSALAFIQPDLPYERAGRPPGGSSDVGER